MCIAKWFRYIYTYTVIELPCIQGRGGSREELHYMEGKEQRLCFAGANVKRYPTSKVRETQVTQ